MKPYAREFADKTIVITGASAGVGRATAREFARAGARLGIIARETVALEQTRTELEAMGARVLDVPADVADAEAVFEAARRIEAALGPIEVWINNAMVTILAPVDEISPKEYHRVTDVTYHGYVHGTMAALRHMKPRNRGVIVQVGSALSYRGIPLQAPYCGAKHAIRGFTDSLRSELLHDRSDIRVTMVQLPAVNTPQFDWARTHLNHQPRPVAPVFEPEPVARAIRDAARGRTREYWLGHSTLKVILGGMLVPFYLDRMLARKGYSGQQRTTPVSPQRQDNLMEPVHTHHRAHGAFDAEASGTLPRFNASRLRLGAVGAVALTALALGVLAKSARQRLS